MDADRRCDDPEHDARRRDPRPVLDLPAGSTAVSPAMCVQSDYPTARTMVRDVAEGQPVSLFATYPAVKCSGRRDW
jgi:hypothetical protein